MSSFEQELEALVNLYPLQSLRIEYLGSPALAKEAFLTLVGTMPRHELIREMCTIVEAHTGENQQRKAINTVREWTRGEATDQEVQTAALRACDASDDSYFVCMATWRLAQMESLTKPVNSFKTLLTSWTT